MKIRQARTDRHVSSSVIFSSLASLIPSSGGMMSANPSVTSTVVSDAARETTSNDKAPSFPPMSDDTLMFRAHQPNERCVATEGRLAYVPNGGSGQNGTAFEWRVWWNQEIIRNVNSLGLFLTQPTGLPLLLEMTARTRPQQPPPLNPEELQLLGQSVGLMWFVKHDEWHDQLSSNGMRSSAIPELFGQGLLDYARTTKMSPQELKQVAKLYAKITTSTIANLGRIIGEVSESSFVFLGIRFEDAPPRTLEELHEKELELLRIVYNGGSNIHEDGSEWLKQQVTGTSDIGEPSMSAPSVAIRDEL